ncbi:MULTISPECIES: hypothetical protein [Nocardiopsis]|uniref:Uncharacterized protein n=1 Tax=Nocardiopsis lambiniae TaxID=3075539 RepID=A0ABU2M726_9ACTN|nr:MULTISPECIES: hypothetical protein [unclassified Nocardiopsis]MDE3724555.1 hypothetical protein [Nocardiopsis sp. N85]MDT0328435.1 hypothetical protein [Nocardiopsis sp. DSM 44743]
MSATIAAVLFGLALLFELIGFGIAGLLTPTTLALAGLIFLALHLAGYGSATGGRRSWRGARR